MYDSTMFTEAMEPIVKDLTAAWQKVLEPNPRRVRIVIENESAAKFFRFQFPIENNPWALELDGTGDHITADGIVGAGSPFRDSTSGIITARIKLSDATSSTIFSANDVDADSIIEFGTDSSDMLFARVRVAGVTKWTLAADVAIPEDKWLVVKLVQDGIEPKLFINNGLQAATFDVSADKTAWENAFTDDSLDKAYVGARKFNSAGSVSNEFTGDIDWFSIDAGSTPGNATPIAHYFIDEGTGSTVGDETPTPYNGTIVNADWVARSTGYLQPVSSGREMNYRTANNKDAAFIRRSLWIQGEDSDAKATIHETNGSE